MLQRRKGHRSSSCTGSKKKKYMEVKLFSVLKPVLLGMEKPCLTHRVVRYDPALKKGAITLLAKVSELLPCSPKGR